MSPYALDNPARRKLLAGQISLGCWCICGNPLLAEVMASSGIEWVMMEMEHFPYHLPLLADCVRAVERGGAVPFARLPACDPVWIKQCLDSGVMGIVLPLIRSVDEVKRAVQWSRFPPIGQRPYGGGRVGVVYGPDYLRRANEHVLTMVQIETREALDQLDAILKVDGYDGCFVGPVDLALTIGKDAVEWQTAMKPIVADLGKRIRSAGKVAGTIAVSVEHAQELAEQGYQMISCFNDLQSVRTAAQSACDKIKNMVQPDQP
jgi:4-hydroxy-2-oxoheptanedioate aldolase